jgi:hypothetical protein
VRSSNLGAPIENPSVANDQQPDSVGHHGIRRQSCREFRSDPGRIAQNKANERLWRLTCHIPSSLINPRPRFLFCTENNAYTL